MSEKGKQPPSEPGLYWVKTDGYRWFNAIAHIWGETPYLHLSSVYFPYDSSVRKLALSDIAEWGDRIPQPEGK